MKKDGSKVYSDMPIIELLQKIKNQTVDPAKLPKEIRGACVEVLFFEGYQQTAMASLFKTCDRTIRRDIEDMRKRNSFHASPELTKELVGDMVAIARASCTRLRRIASSASSSARAMTDAEFVQWTVAKEMIVLLDTIGLLSRGTESPSSKFLGTDLSGLSKGQLEALNEAKMLHPQDRERIIERLYRKMTELDEKIKSEEPKEDPSPSVESPQIENK